MAFHWFITQPLLTAMFTCLTFLVSPMDLLISTKHNLSITYDFEQIRLWKNDITFHRGVRRRWITDIPAHYNDVIMTTVASQITSLTSVYSIVYSDADHRKHQSSASLAFVRGIHRGPVNSPHKWPVTRKMFPFDDVIMYILALFYVSIAD